MIKLVPGDIAAYANLHDVKQCDFSPAIRKRQNTQLKLHSAIRNDDNSEPALADEDNEDDDDDDDDDHDDDHHEDDEKDIY